MKEQINKRFQDNIGRVKNMVDIYEKYLKGKGGRKGHLETDILRAATVFLHASLEDLLRSLSYWKLPDAGKESIDKIPLVGGKGNATKFLLGELVAHKGKTVDDLIKESVNQYLERSNYNNIDEIMNLLRSIEIKFAAVNGEFNALTELMDRRHKIVHRADIIDTKGDQGEKVNPITVNLVNKWIESVEKFGTSVLNEIST
ncbi:MAG: HEPN domain-containing protein [Nitrosomonas sp.]|nr:HEPN domain-containing protein [Nitrosomonas sp.]